jgi:transmembrane sensor
MTGSDDQDDVQAQAAQWFARLKTIPVARETLDAFFEWRRVPEHAEAYRAVEQIWGASSTLDDSPTIRDLTDDAYNRPSRGRRRPMFWGRKAAPAVAAAAVLAAVVAGIEMNNQAVSYTTKIGEQSVVALEDGSRLALDTDTQVEVRFTADTRHVTLERGQAYFTVAHDAARPFLVDAGGNDVLATGTQFDVKRSKHDVAVTLVEGSVRVTPKGTAPIQLASGQAWSRHRDEAPTVHPVDTTVATAWKQGRIVLEGRTLADAIAEVNRYTTRPIRLEAGRYANSQVGGSFDVGDVKGFVAATTALLPLEAVADADGTTRLLDRTAPERKSKTSL